MIFLLPLTLSLFSTFTSSKLMFVFVVVALFVCLFSNEFMYNYPGTQTFFLAAILKKKQHASMSSFWCGSFSVCIFNADS